MARHSSGAPDFDVEGRDWPHRDASHFVNAGGIRWHVQRMGQGPSLLLLHGTGSATHTWRDFAPCLTKDFTLIMPDLPGHGFTGPAPRNSLSLKGFARSVADLLLQLDEQPRIVIGHSSGAAILAQLCLDGLIAPECLIALNGAFLPFEGLAGLLYPPMAKLMHLNPLTARLIAWSTDDASVARLVRGTGSRIDGRGLKLYTRLLQTRAHVDGTLAMMANWDLETLEIALKRLQTPVVLVAGQEDKAVRPGQIERAAALLPRATVHWLAGLGHLAHEEKPREVADLAGRYIAGELTGKHDLIKNE
jgi:magnesium chelatase accessory protein